MTTRLPMDLPDELPIHDASAESVPVKPDPDWNARGRRRLRAALEAMAAQSAPISLQKLREAVSESVPLLEYDRSTTNTGSVRAWNDLGWYLTTNYEHSGWLHATSAGYRITDAGRAQLDAGTTSEELFEVAKAGYKVWDSARQEVLTGPDLDPATQVLYPTNSAAHSERACAPLLAAWRSGDSAFRPPGRRSGRLRLQPPWRPTWNRPAHPLRLSYRALPTTRHGSSQQRSLRSGSRP
jgi:hypothetical protein